MSQPFPITIIMPVYNREQLVQRTLESIAAQTFRPLRVVLVDNGSTDGTLDVLNAWAQSHQASDFCVEVRQEHRPGATAARNKGREGCPSEWIMHFDSDDVMLPDHVQRAWELAQRNPQAWIIGWDVKYHDLQGRTSVKPFYSSHPMYYGIMEGGMATQRYMARTSLFDMAGGWREDVRVWNDIELGARLLAALPNGAEIVKAQGQPTVVYYSTAESITGVNYSERGTEREHAIDCIEQSLPEKYKGIANLKRAILAACYSREGQKQKAADLYSRIQGKGLQTLMSRLAYRYTAAGLPGAAKILRPFF